MNLALEIGTIDVSYWVAFSGGVISFISPCVLPLLPAWLTLITGLSLDEIKSADQKSRAWLKLLPPTLLFVLGISFVYCLLGATAGFIGEILINYGHYFRYLAGIIMIFFGLYLTGFISPLFLMRERRFQMNRRPLGILGSFIVGMCFAAGWASCTGPILVPILALAAVEQSSAQGIRLMAVYSLGLGLPFLILSLAVGKTLSLITKYRSILNRSSQVMGVLLIILGILLISGLLSYTY